MNEVDKINHQDVLDEFEEDAQENMYLSFSLNQEEYGIDIRHVNEVVGLKKITQVPDMPEFVRGVINLRGQLIPLIDVRLRFKMGARDYDDRTCIVVVNIDQRAVGLIVDQVRDVLQIPSEHVDPPPKLRKRDTGRFISGIGKVGDSVKILLDTRYLLSEEDLEQASAMR